MFFLKSAAGSFLNNESAFFIKEKHKYAVMYTPLSSLFFAKKLLLEAYATHNLQSA